MCNHLLRVRAQITSSAFQILCVWVSDICAEHENFCNAGDIDVSDKILRTCTYTYEEREGKRERDHSDAFHLTSRTETITRKRDLFYVNTSQHITSPSDIGMSACRGSSGGDAAAVRHIKTNKQTTKFNANTFRCFSSHALELQLVDVNVSDSYDREWVSARTSVCEIVRNWASAWNAIN